MRASGILMPVFSLPGPYSIGTLGNEAFAFVDFLAAAKQTYWQILPIGPTGYGDSPYQSFSAFAGNPYFIDFRLLAVDGLLTEAELPAPQPVGPVDYGALYQQRPVVLHKAADRLLASPTPAYEAFCEAQSGWLEDYALFMAVKAEQEQAGLSDWPDDLRTREPAALADAPFPLSAQQAVTVRGDTQIAVSLVRAVAKVNFSYTVAADFRNSLSVRSVRLCNVPRFAALFGEGRITADGECAATEAFPADGDGYSAVYYLPENLQGENVSIPGQEQKNEANAPEYAAYILIEGEADGLHVVYRIYLGENNTSDFNIARNRVYRIEARILGRNTVDWRVSTTEVSVTPFAERHAPGRTATAQFRVVSTNNDRSTCFLTCEREEGDGDVTLDGAPILFGVPYPFLSGDGERIAEIAYTQQREGDVRLRLVLTDETGLHAERVLQTSYVREPLRVSFTQDKV